MAWIGVPARLTWVGLQLESVRCKASLNIWLLDGGKTGMSLGMDAQYSEEPLALDESRRTLGRRLAACRGVVDLSSRAAECRVGCIAFTAELVTSWLSPRPRRLRPGEYQH